MIILHINEINKYEIKNSLLNKMAFTLYAFLRKHMIKNKNNLYV